MKLKGKLSLFVILFVVLSGICLSFTNTSFAQDIGPEDLTPSQRRDIVLTYDKNKDGVITSRDVTLMKRAGTYSPEECSNVQKYVVKIVNFNWCTLETTSLDQFNTILSNNKVIYIDYLYSGNRLAKKIAHIKYGNTFLSVIYNYNKKNSTITDIDNLSISQKRDIIKAYDMDRNGKITSRDVALMRRAGTYSQEECLNIQKYVVQLVNFNWCTLEVSSENQYNNIISNNKILYSERFYSSKRIVSKKVAHIKYGNTFVSVVYNCNK